MEKHKSFIRGIVVGIALVAVIDIPIVHWAFGFHRAYHHPSVDIVEPIVVVIAIVFLGYLSFVELKSASQQKK